MNQELYYVGGFLFNLAVAFFIVRFIYYPKNHDRNNIFTFMAFNSIIFFVISILTSVEISVGVGFGLFAIFSILRYRTDPMPVRDMTYLFVILALPVLNSIMISEAFYAKLVIANLAMIVILYVLEMGYGFRFIGRKKIKYEKIDLIRPENHGALLSDLKKRTGINIIRFEIGRIDFLKDCADITIFFEDEKNQKGE